MTPVIIMTKLIITTGVIGKLEYNNQSKTKKGTIVSSANANAVNFFI